MWLNFKLFKTDLENVLSNKILSVPYLFYSRAILKSIEHIIKQKCYRVYREHKKMWFICIFIQYGCQNGRIMLEQHIFLSAVHSLYCMGLKFPYVTLRCPRKLLTFGSFAYSIWLPKQQMHGPNSTSFCLHCTDLTTRVSIFHMYLA